MKPYGLISDLHLHNWQAFSYTLPSKINNRLQGLLNEIDRCCDAVLAAGGNTVYVAGDFFHVRGSVAPSVLNPARKCVKKNIEKGILFRAIPGNHDLEGKHSEEISSAVNLLSEDGMFVAHEAVEFADDMVMMVPWCDTLDELRDILKQSVSSSAGYEKWTLIIHAPLNNVIVGLPDRGLSAKELQELGFKNVFCGHYHNHKSFGNVHSIGALAHHSWSDVNTRAGFLIVENYQPKWFKSLLPAFVDITGEMTPEDAELAADGNYVRLQVNQTKMSEIEKLRAWMLDSGAVGVIIRAVKGATTARANTPTASISAGASIHQSVSEYVKLEFKNDSAAIDRECQKVLAEAMVM